MEIVFMFAGIIALAASALRWGADSRYDSDDPDLEQRPGWHLL